ncbi:hypothetical protein AGMMS50256_26390 [Betaproteobacteria bacterium]|nr:hypothetical protein AGMMS50256_26390 [Betaproteobacteria bacterium]
MIVRSACFSRLSCPLLAVVFSAVAMCGVSAVNAEEQVSVCFNYSCVAQADVVFSDEQLGELGHGLGRAHTPVEEREAIGEAVGRLLGWAGQQSPIFADRGGNYADDAIYGRMDCIDHSTTTTRLLRLLERRGLLRFHRVLEPVRRLRFLALQHYSAVVEEIGQGGVERNEREDRDDGGDEAPARFVVDSWFFDNGHPAVVMLLDAWMSGEGPNGYDE